MKKIIGFIAVVVLILGIFLGYKVVYKASPRDFITKDTRIIYANEGINTKNFTPLLSLIEDEEEKKELSSEMENLKYISKFYIFSDKEFYDISEKTFTGVVDTGYWYFLILKNLGKYFELKDDIYVLKNEYKEKYLGNVQGDLYLKNYKGLFIFSFGEKNLKDFIAKDGKYLYNKEIEDAIDIKRDNLLGTFIYNNSGTDFYGVNLIINSSTIENNKMISESEIIIDDKESEIFKNSKGNRELIKYLDKNDIYVSVDDFSKLDRVIFYPLVIGADMDSKAIFSLWKNILGIDIEEILKEIDGEVLYKLDEQSFMVKIKDEAPEIRRVLTMLTNENTSFYLGNKFEEKDGIIRIGESNFEENKNSFNISKDTFIYGEIDSPKVMGFEGIEAKIQGENKKVNMKVTIPVEVLKEITREY
ncbi:hypothetical protein [Fusobacterium mortiferum]|jgi:hypothetical protein|uniref:Uncharacterized protein n=2 Tax=Fusobacterium mortiferum TaxID=850 RepID=A0A414PPU9_FUSMR|nr:hypothetical protein [Fusobacterium mortiferum]AVQ18010.1 hypothetical protein C4N19_02285 [Fusobacterium mortiferum ATCC 9817]EEO36749.1 hypothetical protein FMAG_02311 [Fusobacterium mortiferum ATCC 9817]MCF2700182.1 hypothetical protein [Fusobacterium mortiferum]MCI7666581.1 hypothetical protein [Fusobacterium mortiferum]MDY2801039.1 hypothetical protein [Fusobacterium mortiferum]